MFDEGHSLKNPSATRTQQLLKLQADFKVVVTGTPLENGVGELWSLAQVFAPGLLGSQAEFTRKYGNPVVNGDAQTRTVAVQALAAIVRPFVLRRLLGAVGASLPGICEQVESVELSLAERGIYEAQRKQAEREVRDLLRTLPEAKQKFSAITTLNKLREVCACPGLHDESFHDVGSKLARLVGMVSENVAAGHRAVVFSQWTRVLAKIEQAFATKRIRSRRIDGTVSQPKRDIAITEFKAGGAEVVLASLGAGGVGIDLQAANYVDLFDPWWNPQKEAQAIARVHRMGQTKLVVATRLLVSDSVEEKLQAMGKENLAIFDDFMTGTSGADKISMADILKLVT